ncbi:MAG: 50S ribosomal protein P1 [Candidatus Aenigmarchaeota archaeon]|nr:50S ribosomal protein P1 [Candidatus Aenigmarchaeota archaeon]
MNYIYGALLLHSAGKEINEENLKKVIDATGEPANEAQVKAVVAALDGVDIKEAIEKAANAPVVAAAPAAPAEESKKEEKKEEDTEKKAEQAAAGLGALFG